MTASDETFGSRLRRLRNAAGLTLTDVAHALDFSPGYLCDVEQGKRSPLHPEAIGRLGVLLGADAVRDLHAVGRPESRLAASESARQAAEARLAAVEAERDAAIRERDEARRAARAAGEVKP